MWLRYRLTAGAAPGFFNGLFHRGLAFLLSGLVRVSLGAFVVVFRRVRDLVQLSQNEL